MCVVSIKCTTLNLKRQDLHLKKGHGTRGRCVAPHTRPHVLLPNGVKSVDKHGSMRSFRSTARRQLLSKALFTPNPVANLQSRHFVVSLDTFRSSNVNLVSVRANTMSPYQQLFSTNAVLSVWRNLRTTKDNNDLLLALHYQQDDVRGQKSKKFGKGGGVVESTQEVVDGKAVDVNGKSIGFVVPWRAMQAQRRELKEKEKELAEALVALAGEVAFTGTCLEKRRSKFFCHVFPHEY